MKPLELEAALAHAGRQGEARSKGTAFLEVMAQSSARRASAARAGRSEGELRRFVLDLPPGRTLHRSEAGFDVIAEVKPCSPSLGPLASEAFLDGRCDPHAALLRAAIYQAAGACMISVLTEPFTFRGSLEHLRRVASGTSVPVMRKDFLVDTYQVWEARAEGADGVLLIARMLDDERLREMIDACIEADAFALLEAFDADDLSRIAEVAGDRPAGRLLAGLNSRDLDSLEVVPGRFDSLADLMPRALTSVAESGLEAPRDARRVAAGGYELALIGTALMRSENPARSVRAFLRAGRSARERLR